MNPIQLMHDLSNLSQVEAFNYCRYVMKPKEVREAVKFYRNVLPTLIHLDDALQALHGKLEANMRILSESM